MAYYLTLYVLTFFFARIHLCQSYIEEIVTGLYTGDDKKPCRLFYATVHTLMMCQWGSKHVVIVYYNSIVILTKVVTNYIIISKL
jgi:hypothetical protein